MLHQDKSLSPARQSPGSVFRSVSASMFGVQSGKKHQEDFGKGNIRAYVIAGFVATLLFVLTVWGVVQRVVRVVQPS